MPDDHRDSTLTVCRRAVAAAPERCRPARTPRRRPRPAAEHRWRQDRWRLDRWWRGRWRRDRERWRRLAQELTLLAIFALIYEEISDHLVQAASTAARHALQIVAAEQNLGLFHERAVQALFASNDTITDAFNAYYGGTHFLVPAFVLGWLLWRHPGQYARARTSLAVATALGFVVFWLFPVAPPRLLPAHFGILDMMRAPDGSGHLESTLITTAGDRYASMPSLHVAWAVWCALALWPVVRPRILRALVVAYPLMTTLVVVATGNHFFLDAFAGAVLACATWVAVTRIGAWYTVHRGTQALMRIDTESWLAATAEPAPSRRHRPGLARRLR